MSTAIQGKEEATGVGFIEYWGQTHGLIVLNIVFPLIWQISSWSADPGGIRQLCPWLPSCFDDSGTFGMASAKDGVKIVVPKGGIL
jgi:hypothetical protein